MLNKVGDRPHVSLAGFSNVDGNILIALVQEYANDIEPFNVASKLSPYLGSV